ncbi:MAG: hypothetical protein ACI85X_001152, partial [Woeseiaceae bacterium]
QSRIRVVLPAISPTIKSICAKAIVILLFIKKVILYKMLKELLSN